MSVVGWWLAVGRLRWSGEEWQGAGDDDVSELRDELLMLHMLERCEQPRMGDADREPGGVFTHTHTHTHTHTRSNYRR